jgi:hypothetical protein
VSESHSTQASAAAAAAAAVTAAAVIANCLLLLLSSLLLYVTVTADIGEDTVIDVMKWHPSMLQRLVIVPFIHSQNLYLGVK